MKNLFTTVKETPKTSGWIILITLLTGISDLIFDASIVIGWSEKLIAYIGLGVSVVTFVINTLISNGVIKSVDVYAKDLFNKILK